MANCPNFTMVSFHKTHSFSFDSVKTKKNPSFRVSSQQKSPTHSHNTNISPWKQQQFCLGDKSQGLTLRKKGKVVEMYSNSKNEPIHVQPGNSSVSEKSRLKFSNNNFSIANSVFLSNISKGMFKCNAAVYQLIKNFVKGIQFKIPKNHQAKNRFYTTQTDYQKRKSEQKSDRVIISLKNYESNFNNDQLSYLNRLKTQQQTKSTKNISRQDQQNSNARNDLNKKIKKQLIANRKIKRMVGMEHKNRQYKGSLIKLSQNFSDNFFIKRYQPNSQKLHIDSHEEDKHDINQQQYSCLQNNLLKNQKQVIKQDNNQSRKKMIKNKRLEPKIRNYGKSVECMENQVEGWKTYEFNEQDFYY